MTTPHTASAALASIAIAYHAHAVKSVDEVVDEYLSDLTRLFNRVWRDDLLPSGAASSHKALIRADAEPAFIEGLAEGGVDEPDLDEGDIATIKEWIALQVGSVTGLWDDVERVIKLYSDGMITHEQLTERKQGFISRLDVWARALRDLASKGKASAMSNMMVTWRYGDTEHCRVCSRLNGTKKRLSWFIDVKGYIPQEIGSETLTCGGWNCLCTLVDSRGRVVLPA